MTPFLIVERDGAVVTATLNRPDQRNALTTDADFQAIVDFCGQVSADRSIRAVVLTGAGSAFCAGGNVKDMKAREGLFKGDPYELRDGYRTGIQRIPLALWELEVPVVAAINGPAIGAGLDLACMCDIRIAARTASFAHSFVKLGLVPGDGGAWLLPRVIGQARAAMMTLTGDMIDAETALAYGLVNELADPADLLASAQAIAGRIAANPGHATRLGKRLLRDGQDMTLKSVLELSAAYQALAHHTRDHEEAVDAFLEKRAPDYKDR